MANEPYRQTNFPFEIVYATAAQWATSGDYVLQRYQLGVESNTGNAKLGDGDSTWDELYYWPPNSGYDNNTSVRVATTANITIATALNDGDTLDGVTLATGDLVLVKNQSAPEENGIYVVGVTPVRAPAYDAYNEYPGAMVSVTEGTVGGNTLWLCTSNRGGTLGTTAIDFAAFGTPETTASLGALINGASAATLADADLVPVVQSSVTLKTTFTAIKAFLATWLGFTAASASGPTSFVFKEDTDNGAHGITLKAPAAVTANVDVTLPDAAGTLALGAASSTDLAIVIFDGTTGKIVKNSLVTVSATGEILMPGGVALKMNGAPVLWDDGTEVLVGAYDTNNRPLWFYAQQVNVGRWLANGQLNMVYPVSWGATIGSEDVGLGRSAAGVLKATNGSTGITGFMGGGGAVASDTALPLPTGRVFHVTGTTNITSIVATNLQSGVIITMIFDDVLTVSDANNINLSAAFVSTAGDTLTLAFDGTNFYEVGRSVN